MQLVIIEGAGKIKKIKEILGPGYQVFATCGHIKQLNEKINHGYGFEFSGPKAFYPSFETLGIRTPDTKHKVIKEMVSLADKADQIYIATDPDREGEAIAYHIYESLGTNQKKAVRISFNAINKTDILNAIANPKEIDMDLVHAQFCRQVYDRYLGYQLSDYVRKIIQKDKMSAGRVQSAALLLIALRENEIRNYVPSYWYTLDPVIQIDQNQTLKVKLVKPVDKFLNEQEAYAVLSKLDKHYLFDNLELKEGEISKPNKPLITSEALTIGSKKLGWSAKKTTNVLQKLYEYGFITYPRTDSIRIHEEFCQTAYQFVVDHYGIEYGDNSFWFNDLKQKDSVQDGHECLRVVDLNIQSLDDLQQKLKRYDKNYLADGEMFWMLYEYIYLRTIQVFFKPAIYTKAILTFLNQGYVFETKFKTLTFDGFKRLTAKDINETDDLDDDTTESSSLNYEQLVQKLHHQFEGKLTKPTEHHDNCPSRYEVGDLIKKLEQLGIGRPSSFATMAEINIERENVMLQKKKMYLTEKGERLNNLIQKIVPSIINIQFTSELEKELDQIEQAQLDWHTTVLRYVGFLNQSLKSFNAAELQKEFGFKPQNIVGVCPICQGDVYIKTLKNGQQMEQCVNRTFDKQQQKFVGCSYAKLVK